jgi:hypothetical protein
MKWSRRTASATNNAPRVGPPFTAHHYCPAGILPPGFRKVAGGFLYENGGPELSPAHFHNFSHKDAASRIFIEVKPSAVFSLTGKAVLKWLGACLPSHSFGLGHGSLLLGFI